MTKDRPDREKALEDAVDELMATLTVILLDFDKAKVEALKDDSPLRVEAIYAIRMRAIKVILALFPDIEDLQKWYDGLLAEFKKLKMERVIYIEEAKRKVLEEIELIIKEYKLESCSVRDDMLELRAVGWKLFWQVLEGGVK